MKNQLLHRLTAGFVFVVSLIQFLLTAQVSVSFWDPGELSAASYMLQVPHPPGGPLFLLIGRLFYLLPISGDLGFRMNMVSVLASAFSTLMLYLIAVKVMQNYTRKESAEPNSTLSTYIAAAIGALTFSFSDTFWFNGVESNYFATSTLLFSTIVWIMMVWNEKADEPDSGRYLVLIAFLVGLSGGVHLMSVLTIIAVSFTVVLRRTINDETACKKTGYILIGHVALLLVVAAIMWGGQTSQQAPTTEEIDAFDQRFVVTMGIVSLAIIGLFWKKVVTRNSIYVAVLAGGVALFLAYPGIIKLLPSLLLKIAGDNSVMGLLVLVVLLALGGSAAYWAAKNRRTILHLSILGVMVAILGFTTYTMILIRAGTSPPMNENNPRDFTGLVSYLNREQYGEFPIFKRRWSPEPEKQAIYTKYSSDLDFFWRYQMDHMFQRYIFWNFIGRESHDQDAGVDVKGYFGIPFVLGLLGLYLHFRRDWKLATVFLVLFIFMGYLIAFYQNQQEPQPRDREYFYPGAYFVFALWIALGIRGIFEWLQQQQLASSYARPAFFGVTAAAVLLLPGRMLQVNYFTHDRSRNWVPWDYSYNMLQTCEKDAILFTNGDNDTFPLWYLQDVEGVRRDVRIVNLSLINTPWYIQQMKEKPYYPEAKAVPISIPDSRIAQLLGPVPWEPAKQELAVPPEVYARFGVTDSAEIKSGKIEFMMNNTLQYGSTKAIRVQDLMVRDIVLTTQWTRPIYFAVTCAPDSRIGLDQYFWFDGLAWRLEPKKVMGPDQGLNPGILAANLFHAPEGYSKTPEPGYKWRSIADPRVFFDENTTRLMINYRSAFIRLSLYYSDVTHDTPKSVAALDRMEQLIPRSRVPMGWELQSDVASFYNRLGQTAKARELDDELEPICRQLIETGQVNMNSYYNPYRVLLEIYDMRKDYEHSLDLLKRLALLYPNDSGLKQRISDVQKLLALQGGKADTLRGKAQ